MPLEGAVIATLAELLTGGLLRRLAQNSSTAVCVDCPRLERPRSSQGSEPLKSGADAPGAAERAVRFHRIAPVCRHFRSALLTTGTRKFSGNSFLTQSVSRACTRCRHERLWPGQEPGSQAERRSGHRASAVYEWPRPTLLLFKPPPFYDRRHVRGRFSQGAHGCTVRRRPKASGGHSASHTWQDKGRKPDTGFGLLVMSDAKAAASEAVSRRCHELRFRGPVSLVAALVTLKDAGLSSIPFDRIGRAPSQMRIAAAFAAADRSNKSLLFDDVRTPFHSPVRDQHPQATFNCGKRGIRTASVRL